MHLRATINKAQMDQTEIWELWTKEKKKEWYYIQSD